MYDLHVHAFNEQEIYIFNEGTDVWLFNLQSGEFEQKNEQTGKFYSDYPSTQSIQVDNKIFLLGSLLFSQIRILDTDKDQWMDPSDYASQSSNELLWKQIGKLDEKSAL